MELRVAQLADHLQDKLAPIYFISGDEPLQIEESLSLLRSHAREQGYDDRHVMHVERGFNWDQLAEQTSNLSLFSEKKILELRMPSGKPGTAGAKALQNYCAQLPEDHLLLIQSGKLDKSTLRTKWAQAIANVGVLIRVWPLTGMDLIRWVQTRLRQHQLADDRQTAEYIASRVEGNMLAAAQEIEKMTLLQLGEQGSNQSALWMSNQAKYNVFDLVDTILIGQRAKVVKILKQLQAESFAPNLVLWALAELVRAVIYTAQQGRSLSKGVQNVFYYNKKNQLTSQAHKYSDKQLYVLLEKCAHLDQVIKGRATGNAWHGFTEIALKMSR